MRVAKEELLNALNETFLLVILLIYCQNPCCL